MSWIVENRTSISVTAASTDIPKFNKICLLIRSPFLVFMKFHFH